MKKLSRKIIWLVLFLFTFNLIPYNAAIKAGAADDINVISSTEISVSTAKSWARSRNATDTFVGLADLYWRYASQHGNVNPAVAYVQAAKETGYGKFGGIINESYHNPCGLKTSQGGSDTDPDAHQKFNSWDEGVQAHLDHLALYAGASGYPRSNTYDPRHFSSIFGTAKTVQALGGRWAPSSSYGTDIMGMYNTLLSMQEMPGNITVIDTPSNGANVTADILTVSGWALNSKGVSKVNVYLDGKLQTTAKLGISRPDVAAIYPSYSNQNSGYNAEINLANISDGVKTLKVEQVGKDNSVDSTEVKINIIRHKPIQVIDYPVNGENVTENTLTVGGWSLNNNGVKAINIYLDGKLKVSTNVGISRPDVAAVYPQYKNAATSGYKASFDITDIAEGQRKLKVEQVASNGEVIANEITINIKRPSPITVIDYPVNGESITGNTLSIGGWALNNIGINKINIYVDGKLKGTAQRGISRPDVVAAYPQYTKEATSGCGYTATVDITDISGGNKTVKVEQVANDGKTYSTETKVYIDKPMPIQVIDYPVNGENVTGNTLTVGGWSLNNSGVKAINIYLDGKLKVSTNVGISRPDVAAVYPQYKNAATSGYKASFDITDIAEGQRKLKVEQVASNGEVIANEITINIKRPSPITVIDYPVNGENITGNTLSIGGWALNNIGINKINIYVDGKLKGTAQRGISRPDVVAAYPQYTKEATSGCGYTATVDITDISGGNKTVKVEQVANDGKTYSTETKVYIDKPMPIQVIDYPVNGENVTGDTLTVGGWSLNNNGVKAINIYLDGKLKVSTNVGISRQDVAKVYPQYKNAATSGYKASFDITDIAEGQRKLKVEQVASNGEVIANEITINIKRPSPITVIDYPANGENITSKNITVSGWALNASGVKEIKIYINNKEMTTTSVGLSRLDVSNVYPQYNDSKSGYTASININEISAGSNTITVKQIGKDGTEDSVSKKINIVKKTPISVIDNPSSDMLVISDNLDITGWALNDSGVKYVNIYLDGVKVGTPAINISRNDVIAVYPGYQTSNVCGFSTTINLSGLPKGQHTVVLEAVGNDGSLDIISRNFYYKEQPSKVVVVDPGHNNGGDEGAIATVNGKTYYERLLNDAIALETKSALESKGYRVFFTRMPYSTDVTPLNESLANRVSIANSLNADIFISIHQNTYTNPAANGTEVYYSSKHADSGYSGPSDYNYKLNTSKKLASDVLSNIVRTTGFTNRGVKDESFFVCRNTNMPSILVECGFISNYDNVSKLDNPQVQSNIGEAIASGVKSVIG